VLELFWTDQHIPHHDKAAHDLVLQMAYEIQPDRIWLGGDWCDFESVSRWAGNPARKLKLPQEVARCSAELQRLRDACPNAEILFKEGNHETRLTRFLYEKAEELSGLECLNLKELLGLDAMEIQWVDNLKRTKYGKLYHLHGNEIKASGINISSTVFRKLGVNAIFGHFHRTQTHLQRFYDREVRGAWCIGTTGHLEPEYATHNDWSHSIAIVEYANSGNFQVDVVPITKNRKKAAKALWQGHEYTVSF